MKLVEYADRDVMWLAIAREITGALRAALSTGGRAALAVPGGTTPGPLFDVISGVGIDWDRVDVMLTDERWVDEDSPRSNTRLLRERLFVGKAAAARLIPLYGGTATPEESIAALEGAVRAATPLTVVLLGMGADMHTASLFPGADKLELALSEAAPALVAMRAPGAQEPRITLSAPVLNGALAKHLVIVGADKRAALDKAAALRDPVKAPVAAVLDGMIVHWAPE